ncbi:MAG: diacylglycerol kinase family protein [Pseudomonadota bacterium]
MKILLAINEKSGAVQRLGADAIEAMARRVAAAAGATLNVVRGDADRLIGAAEAARDMDAVATAGGDGTQAAIAGVLMGAEAPLLPLPCGTLNLLCRDLSMPLDIEDAFRTSLQGAIAEIDVGVVTASGSPDRVFLNNVVFGAYGELAEAREELRDAETIAETTAGVAAAARSVLNADPLTFTVRLDGQAQSIDTNTIVVSNNAITHSNGLVPQREALASGKLAVYLTQAADGGDFAVLLADFLAGRAAKSNAIHLRNARRCAIHARGKTFSYTVDGDPLESVKEVTLALKPRALKVLRPN